LLGAVAAQRSFLPAAVDLELYHIDLSMDFRDNTSRGGGGDLLQDSRNSDVDLISYDTTPLHFEVDEEMRRNLSGKVTSTALRRRGHWARAYPID